MKVWFIVSEGFWHCSKRIKSFLIVFIFTSGVGNGLLKPVHRLCFVSAETVSNAPNTPPVETPREALSDFNKRTAQNTFEKPSRGSLSAQSFSLNTPKSRDTIARHASNEEGKFVSSTAVDNGIQRTSVEPAKYVARETYGERLRRLSSQGNRGGNRTGNSYATQNERAPIEDIKLQSTYPSEAVERKRRRGSVPKDDFPASSPEPSSKEAVNTTSGTSTALKEAVPLHSDDDEPVSTEADRSEILRGKSQSEVINKGASTGLARSSETEKG